jgi:flagellar biosynthetic protein FlhB
MAAPQGDRTEYPTARRVKDARERGQVARSRDLAGAASLVGVALTLAWFGTRMLEATTTRLAASLTAVGTSPRADINPVALAGGIWSDLGLFARVAGPPAAVAAVLSIGASLAQVGWSYSPKAIQFNWGRINPASGFQRLAPMQALPELGKALLGLSAIGVLCYLCVRPFYVQAPLLMAMTPGESAAYGWDRLWSLLWRASLALVVLAGGDYLVQRFRWLSQLKMTRQEVRDEARQYEGNPEIRSRVRRVQREMTRRRMLHAVKSATVVVTNPTHFAVALQYRREGMTAPLVVAKGQDALAARIRAAAREHGVPIVENVTLARALYKTTDVGDAIPASLFGAVAEVLAYLVRLKQLVL